MALNIADALGLRVDVETGAVVDPTLGEEPLTYESLAGFSPTAVTPTMARPSISPVDEVTTTDQGRLGADEMTHHPSTDC
jgi:hypothetical protein